MEYRKTYMPDNPVKLHEVETTNRPLRMNLRNAWMAEPVQDVRARAVEMAGQNRWFEAAVLFELACDIYAEG